MGFNLIYVNTYGLRHLVGLQPIKVETEGFSIYIVLKLYVILCKPQARVCPLSLYLT